MARVLIVDDQIEMVWRGWMECLNIKGHETIFAVNGRKGLEALVQKPNIIFLDFAMPVMDGYDFSKEIRMNRDYSEYAGLPIIGVGAFPETMREYLTEFIPKSQFGLNEQIDCIKRYCTK